MELRNPFENESEAIRYDRYRTRYHHLLVGEIRRLVGHDFVSSLDVACGTGHSTVAISKVSRRTIGCDSSVAMLAQAPKHLAIEFLRARAEQLPFGPEQFDFVNISMGYHWVDQDKFLLEARRVLKEGGYLCVENYSFQRRISEDTEKQRLHSDFMDECLPPASRRAHYPSDEQLKSAGLHLVKEITYGHQVAMNSEEFSNLIMTWSNYQVLSEQRKRAIGPRLRDVYDRIFQNQKLKLDFGGKARIFRK